MKEQKYNWVIESWIICLILSVIIARQFPSKDTYLLIGYPALLIATFVGAHYLDKFLIQSFNQFYESNSIMAKIIHQTMDLIGDAGITLFIWLVLGMVLSYFHHVLSGTGLWMSLGLILAIVKTTLFCSTEEFSKKKKNIKPIIILILGIILFICILTLGRAIIMDASDLAHMI